MVKKLIAAILSIFLGVFNAASQSRTDTVYQINWNVDAPVIAGSAGINALAFISIHNLSPRNANDLNNLSHGHLIGLDERAIQHHSAAAKTASDWVAGGAVLLPLTLMADKDIREQALNVSVLFSETALVTNGLVLATKRIVRRDRPYVFNPETPLKEKLAVKSMLSFYSGHTAMTASMSFFTAKVWSDYHPNSPWKPVVWSAAATLPVVTGYLRYKAGKHYFTDVATGYAMGALVGYLVPHFHKVDRRSKRRYRISSTFTEGVPLLTFKCRL
ncbi:MAG: phosphatase PAP2 family protein [Saprospiraceae bacterium]|nr:phosphatase PAP2 family protein [Saprospiraceae bacterium]MCF8252255.1 phosphatase PAP2 family protein [Saprospiraceae bacterium]MCF8313916.1 phosphatase PAP2 family protein [Saprospiraceae bacterium]MCF8443247.1 phosphatase PAP2 family protein [Saprospiraceae bacterium]